MGADPLTEITNRRTAGQREIPQALAVLQEALDAPDPNENPPVTFEANIESFLVIFRLPQVGQFSSSITLALRTSSSNGWLHSLHMNS